MAKSCLVASLVTCQNLIVILARFWSGHYGQIKIMVGQILACWNLFRLDKILPCFLARLYLDQILPGTLEKLGVNTGKILANLLQGNLGFHPRSWEIFLVGLLFYKNSKPQSVVLTKADLFWWNCYSVFQFQS